MNTTMQSDKLLGCLKPGQVYRREDLVHVTPSVDRVLRTLVQDEVLVKLNPGLYYMPEKSRWGEVPASLNTLVESYLKTKDFLLVSNDAYNTLGLGLTQLWNEMRVYNKKRHLKTKLGNYNFSFQRPNNGYPKKLSKEFLLVDLLNNLSSVGEDPGLLVRRVLSNLDKFDAKSLKKLSDKYGKVSTKKFFEKALN